MKARYRLIRRGIRGGAFYSVDTTTGKRTSLGTADEDEAKRLQAETAAELDALLPAILDRAFKGEFQPSCYAATRGKQSIA